MPKESWLDEIDFMDIQDEDVLDEKKTNNRIRSIIRGVVKIELIKRLEEQKELFPLTHRESLYYINFYIVQKKFNHAPKEVKKSILDSAKSIHTKEMHRIRKAFLTLRNNIATETVDMLIEKDLYEKIYRYLVYQWLKEEFYIKKTIIRRYIYGLVVFFPEIKPEPTIKLSSDLIKTSKPKPKSSPRVLGAKVSSDQEEKKSMFDKIIGVFKQKDTPETKKNI